MNVFAMTDVGKKREMNQDFVYASRHPVGNLPNLFIVADGMGGHNAGDYASRLAVQVIAEDAQENPSREPAAILRQAIASANRKLVEEASQNLEYRGMGTTAVVAALNTSGSHLWVANIGDSRLYMVGTDKIWQVTRDHSLVEEMVRRGEITKEAARIHPDRNIITRAIGVAQGVDVDVFEVEACDKKIILMCSDGLTNMVTDEELYRVIRGPGSLEEKGEILIALANENGGRDNITVLLIEPMMGEVKRC